MNNISSTLQKDTEGWRYEVFMQVTHKGPSPSLDVHKHIRVIGREYHKRDAEKAVSETKRKLKAASEVLA